MRSVLGELLAGDDARGGDVIVDMEAGLEHLSRGTTRHVDALWAVAEPYYRSLETARRIYDLARELGIGRVRLVANKARDEEESAAIRSYAERHGLRTAGAVPFDEAVVRADREARAPVDAAGPDAPAIHSLGALADALLRPEAAAPPASRAPATGR